MNWCVHCGAYLKKGEENKHKCEWPKYKSTNDIYEKLVEIEKKIDKEKK